ncbi:hypothetical protein Tco_1246983 [Tanacetum coccineum]
MQNPEDISDPTTALDMALELMSKAFQLNNTTTTNNNQRSSSNPCYSQIAQSGMNMDQDRQMQMVDDNVVNYVVSGIANQHGNGNVVTTWTEGNSNEINGNQIRLLKRMKQRSNSIMRNLISWASTSGTQSDNAPVYDSDGSTEVPKDENCYDHDIFNMLAHEVQYTDLQTELDRTKEKLENSIIKKEKEYAVLWNNWFTNQNAPRIFRINPFKALRVDNFVPNKHVKASARTKPITVSQPHVITKKDVNFITNGFSSKNIESTTRTRRPQLMNNLKSDKVPFKSKSSCLSNKLEKIKENHRSLQSSDYPDHTSYACNNIKLTIQNEKYEVICATCKQYLITANHDEYVLQYVNGMKYRTTNQSANVSKSANQQKQKANVKKSKMLSSEDRLTLSRPSKPRTCLKWLPTGRIFDLCGKITPSSNTESESDTSVCDNASASNPQEPTNKGFPSSTSFLGYSIAAENFAEKIEAIQADVRLKLEASNAKYKEDRDKHRRTNIYAEGDLIMKINNNAYVVDLPKDMAISNTFNVLDLVDYHSPDAHLYPSENSRSSPLQVGENDEGDNLERH